ncbi:Fic family protein [Candidatus Saccharibacteria bacterium]|nr:Fic family protein [Candidatus Saccharibacteria bacterium]
MNENIISLLRKREEIGQILDNLVFGAAEIRTEGSKKNLYVHFRVSGKQITKFVGEYSDELLNTLTINNQKAKELKKSLREVNHKIRELGYIEAGLSEKTKRNIDFAKRNLALTIHSQAILEGVATTFASTEEIIEGGRVSGMSATDVQKILNMKHAWEFVLDKDVIQSKTDLGLMQQINKLIEDGFYYAAGEIRDVPVSIGGTAWRPELPIRTKIQEDLEEIQASKKSRIDKAIDLMLFIQRSQIFLDGNKRTAIIFANHYLIKNGLGLMYVPEDKTDEYKKLLVNFYESGEKKAITTFVKKYCIIKI